MAHANVDARSFFSMSDSDLYKVIGKGSLDAGFGATDLDDEEAEAEGKRIVEDLQPAKADGLCSHVLVRAFIANPTVEVGCDIVGVIGDVICHTMVSVPPVTLTVAFIRFGLRKFCEHGG